MFFSNGRKALKLRKYTILVFAVVVVVFLALLAIYIEPPQPNVDIQANTKFDIERYLSEDIPKTDTILEIKLKSEKYYPDLTLKLDTQYLNFSYEEYVNYTYNSSNTISKPAGFIPPNGVPVGGGPPVIGAFVTPYDSSLEEEIDGGGTMHGGGPSVGGGGAPGGLTKTPYHGCIDSINDKYLIYNTSNYTGFIYDGLNNTFYSADIKLCYEHENFTLYPKEEKTFCFPIDFSNFSNDQKSTEVTIELIDNNRSNLDLDSSYVRITKFINMTIPSANIRNLCNNIVKYVSARKPDNQIKTINYNFEQISTADEIKLWFILFVPKYVEFLSTNVEIQNEILDILEGSIRKALLWPLLAISFISKLWQGLSSEGRLLFVTFLYVIATAAICLLYTSPSPRD